MTTPLWVDLAPCHATDGNWVVAGGAYSFVTGLHSGLCHMWQPADSFCTSFETKAISAYNVEPPQIDVRWIFDAILSKDECSLEKLTSIIDGVNSLIARSDFERLDRVLECIPVNTASRHVLLTLARATYPVRIKLAYWKKFILNLKDAFAKRGLEADKLLRGLQ